MKLRALNDYVIIKEDNKHTPERSVILLEDETPCSGVVVSVAEFYYDENDVKTQMPIKVGDDVIFATNIIKCDELEEGYHVMKLENVIGVGQK